MVVIKHYLNKFLDKLFDKCREHKQLIGLLMILGGVLLGLYVGVWLCFIGGIVSVMEQFKADEISSVVVGWGVFRIFCAAFIGSICAFCLIIPGCLAIKD